MSRQQLRPAIAGDFNLGPQPPECDLVLKGGVTSGVVYPYAILEIAKKYRLRSIGGASSGAIAASFAAAAEYARRNGEPEGFVRLEERCSQLPKKLAGLFRPEPQFRRLFEVFVALTRNDQPKGNDLRPPPDRDAARRLLRGLLALWREIAAGAAVGAAVYAAMLGLTQLLFSTAPWTLAAAPGLLFAAFTGAVIAPVACVVPPVFRGLQENRFGMCSGLAPDDEDVLTNWIHKSLQFIAFGDREHAPLTFGDLIGGAGHPQAIDLRMMATNLSTQQPEVIPPREASALLFDLEEWKRLFPSDVINYLTDNAQARSGFRALPPAEHLPVLVGVRASLAFPFLIQAVPMLLEDRSTTTGGPPPIAAVWISDGGITSNFPIHFFDVMLPGRPTFAISVDELPEHEPKAVRVTMPQDAVDDPHPPIHKIRGIGDLASAILASGKDWQDQMQSVMPGQRQRIVRVRLEPWEGGFNLRMDPKTSDGLALDGQDAGDLVRKAFDYNEHRWRRTLIAYEQLEELGRKLGEVWPTYRPWYDAYEEHVKSYRKEIPLEARRGIRERLDKFTDCAATAMTPPVEGEFPRPKGRLRIVPDMTQERRASSPPE